MAPSRPLQKKWKTQLINLPGGEGEAGEPPVAEAARPKDVPAKQLPKGVQAKLRVIEGALSGEVYQLQQPYSVVGRRDDCDVVIDDESVSGRHIAIYCTVSRGWRVEDLASTNGTELDGTAVHEAALSPGAVISLGACVLKFEIVK